MRDNKVNFTKTALTNLESNFNGKRAYYYDTKVSGLGIMVFPSGAKTFFLYKRINGKPDKIKLGKFPKMTVEKARKAAINALDVINEGGSPNDKKKQLNNELTFGELFAKFIEEYAKNILSYHKLSYYIKEQSSSRTLY